MKYLIHILSTAEKELDAFPGNVYDRLINRILLLENNPRPRGVKKLSGRE